MFELSNSLPASPMPAGSAEQQQQQQQEAETQALTSNGGNGHSVARIGHDDEEEEEEEELSPSAAPSAGGGCLFSPLRLVFSPSLRSTSLRLCLLYFLMAFVYYGLVLLAMNVVVEEEEEQGQGQYGNQKREVSKKKKQEKQGAGGLPASRHCVTLVYTEGSFFSSSSLLFSHMFVSPLFAFFFFFLFSARCMIPNTSPFSSPPSLSSPVSTSASFC